MKRRLLYISSILLTLICACNGPEEINPQDDVLRLDFGAVTAAVQDGASVADISAVERDGVTVGYVVSFAGGSGITLLDMAEGGKVVTGLHEDARGYCFALEGGEELVLPKAFTEPFGVELTGDEAELTDGGSLAASYKVSGAGEGLEVTALVGEGWSAEIAAASGSEGTVRVTAPDPITTDKVLLSFKDGDGRQVVRALRLTSKSAVKRGNIETYVFAGVNYTEIDPETVDPATALRRYQAVVDAGIQIMEACQARWWDSSTWNEEAVVSLDLAEKVGLKLAMNIDRIYGDNARVASFVNAVKDKPALWGYQVLDEPNSDYFPGIAETKQIINSLDGKHPCYINLHGYGCSPEGSYHAASYQDYLNKYVAQTDPDFISFDVYPCFPDWVLDQDWYPSLELVSKKAKESGIGFWAFASSCRFSDGYGLRIKPTMASLRLQHYTNLAYGAECLEYFTWSAAGDAAYNFSDWPTDMNGDINTTNPTYEYVQAVNREIQNRAFVYDGCDLKWSAYLNDIPLECRAVDNSQIPDEIVSYRSESDLLMTLIENDGGRSEYLNVMSRTHIKPSAIRIRFRYPVQTVERDGSLKTLNPGDYDFTIEPGDILIIKTR